MGILEDGQLIHSSIHQAFIMNLLCAEIVGNGKALSLTWWSSELREAAPQESRKFYLGVINAVRVSTWSFNIIGEGFPVQTGLLAKILQSKEVMFKLIS